MSVGLVRLVTYQKVVIQLELLALDGLLDPKSGGISWQPSLLSTCLLELVDSDWGLILRAARQYLQTNGTNTLSSPTRPGMALMIFPQKILEN